MQRFVALLTLIFAMSPCFASEPITVPIAFDSGRPVVTLNFNGKSIPFLLDTGSSKTFHLDKGLAKQFPDLIYTGKTARSVDAAGHVQENPEVVFPKLSVNGLEFGKVNGLILKPWGLSIGKGKKPNPNTSVLGLSFFDGKKLIIDYAAKRLTIADADNESVAQQVADWTSYPYERSKAGQVLVLSSGKARYRMVLDSPSNISLVKGKLAEAQDDVAACDMNLGPDRPCRKISLALPGGRPLEPVLFDLPEAFPEDGLVGQAFFFQYAVYIDSEHRVLKLRAAQ